MHTDCVGKMTTHTFQLKNKLNCDANNNRGSDMNIAFPSFALDNQSIIMNPLSSYLRSEQRNVSSRPSFLRNYRLNIYLQFIW